ncbi:MAG: hypothetical protein ACRCWQ_06890 [Bacilli bacterium]
MQPGTRIKVKAKAWVLANSTHYRLYSINFRVLEVFDKGTELEKVLAVRTEALDGLCEQIGTLKSFALKGTKKGYALIEMNGERLFLPKQILEEVKDEQIALF